jgi:hypothetical protein
MRLLTTAMVANVIGAKIGVRVCTDTQVWVWTTLLTPSLNPNPPGRYDGYRGYDLQQINYI